jgi:hypothetical protein
VTFLLKTPVQCGFARIVPSDEFNAIFDPEQPAIINVHPFPRLSRQISL